ncbi:hypothetical protein LI328DRAFT_84185 [Trichoderma asperelloides]|nr:hypothetical protein LI328DRAFT_84185 [Trichoderma asperelloides]
MRFWRRLSRLSSKTRSFAPVPFFSPHLHCQPFTLFSPRLIYLYSGPRLSPCLALPSPSPSPSTEDKSSQSSYPCFRTVSRLQKQSHIAVSGNRACKAAPPEIGLISILLRFIPHCAPPARHRAATSPACHLYMQYSSSQYIHSVQQES